MKKNRRYIYYKKLASLIITMLFVVLFGIYSHHIYQPYAKERALARKYQLNQAMRQKQMKQMKQKKQKNKNGEKEKITGGTSATFSVSLKEYAMWLHYTREQITSRFYADCLKSKVDGQDISYAKTQEGFEYHYELTGSYPHIYHFIQSYTHDIPFLIIKELILVRSKRNKNEVDFKGTYVDDRHNKK